MKKKSPSAWIAEKYDTDTEHIFLSHLHNLKYVHGFIIRLIL